MGNKNRGSTTHGHGSSKKRRGKGNRAGKGHAGYGKKAKPKVIKATKEGEKDKGFSLPQSSKKEVKTINLQQIDQNIDRFVRQEIAEETSENDFDYVFKAGEGDYDKVLGSGQLRNKIKIKASDFSSKAKEKINESDSEFVKTEE